MTVSSDRTTKLLLLAIALGLWVHLLIPLFRPAVAVAGDRVQVEVVNEVRVKGTVRMEPAGSAMEVNISPEFGSRPIEVKVVN